jgi:glycosyltransferase involved in cell wall biosynthesis
VKVAFLGGNFDLSGGTERVTSTVANGLARLGHQIHVISMQGGRKPYFGFDAGICIHSLHPEVGRNLPRYPQLVCRLRSFLRRERVDALVVVESMLALFTVPALFGLPVRHICWEHFNYNVDLGVRARALARRLAARYCDAVVTLTEADRKCWAAMLSPRARLVAIPNPTQFSVQRERQPPTGSRVVLGVGRLTHEKGFDLALAAWKTVASQEPSWRLRIVGNGSARAALGRLAAELGIQDSVDFVEASAEIERHYREAAIYCLSSRFEGFGLVLIEAATFGLPIVSFDCQFGPSEILEGTGSVLVPAGDVEALGRALLGLIRNPGERARVSQALLRRAEDYQPAPILAGWEQVLRGDGQL